MAKRDDTRSDEEMEEIMKQLEREINGIPTNKYEIMEYLETLGFKIQDELDIPREWDGDDVPDLEPTGDKYFSYKVSSESTKYDISFNTNYISEWESDGVKIFIDDADAIQYISLDNIETFLKIIKFTE